jgi:hypothetical protein
MSKKTLHVSVTKFNWSLFKEKPAARDRGSRIAEVEDVCADEFTRLYKPEERIVKIIALYFENYSKS